MTTMMMKTSFEFSMQNPFAGELINDFVDLQKELWPMAHENYDRLREVKRKPLQLGALSGAAQLNPARIVSTGAKVDAKSVAKRPCFLCAANRPKEQLALPWFERWELLLNPFPILPIHFTIASCYHQPQACIPEDIIAFAEMAPDLCFFYNGAHAGASAPDHLHTQAVLSSELPLMRLVEELHPDTKPGLMQSSEMDADLPFGFVSAVIEPTQEGMRASYVMTHLCGYDNETKEADPGLVNAFAWIGKCGLLRMVVIPRRAHRPSHYSATDPDKHFMVSPGAIDMTGLMILPRPEDFDRMTPQIAKDIYKEVAYPQQHNFLNGKHLVS